MSEGVRCDVCGAFADGESCDGWMSVTPLDMSPRVSLFLYPSQQVRPAHVCSFECLGLLAVNREVPFGEAS